VGQCRLLLYALIWLSLLVQWQRTQKRAFFNRAIGVVFLVSCFLWATERGKPGLSGSKPGGGRGGGGGGGGEGHRAGVIHSSEGHRAGVIHSSVS